MQHVCSLVCTFLYAACEMVDSLLWHIRRAPAPRSWILNTMCEDAWWAHEEQSHQEYLWHLHPHCNLTRTGLHDLNLLYFDGDNARTLFVACTDVLDCDL